MDVDQVKKFAETMLAKTRMMVEAGEKIMPTAFIIDPDGILEIVGMPFNGAAEKEIAAAFMKKQAMTRRAIVVFISDAWTVRENDPVAALDIIRRGGSLQYHPNRTETLVLSVFGPDIKTMFAKQPYTRKNEGIEWEELVWMDDTTGRFAPDLTGRGTSH